MLPLTLVLSGCTAVYSAKKPAIYFKHKMSDECLEGLGLGIQVPAAVYVHGHKKVEQQNYFGMDFNGLYIRQKVEEKSKNNAGQHWHWIRNLLSMRDSYYASLDCHRGKVYNYLDKSSKKEIPGYIPKYYIVPEILGNYWEVYYTKNKNLPSWYEPGHYGVHNGHIGCLRQSDSQNDMLPSEKYDLEGEYTQPIRNVADVCKLENMVGLEVIQEWCEKLKNERNGVRDEILDILQRYLRQKQCLRAIPHVNLAGEQLEMWKNMEFSYTGFNAIEILYIKKLIRIEVKKIAVPQAKFFNQSFIDQKMVDIKKTVREELSRKPWNVTIGLSGKDSKGSTTVIKVQLGRY